MVNFPAKAGLFFVFIPGLRGKLNQAFGKNSTLIVKISEERSDHAIRIYQEHTVH